MTVLVDRAHLTGLAKRSRIVRGAESFEHVLGGRPDDLVTVSEPSFEPLDARTYRLRLENLDRVDASVAHGMREFVEALEGLREPARALMVIGEATTYVLLVSSDLTSVVASAAIDRQFGDSPR